MRLNWTQLVMMGVLFTGSFLWGQATGSAAEKGAAPVPVFSIAVAPPADPIHLGAPINVVVTVTNISNGDIYWQSDRGQNSPYKAFSFLLQKGGHEVETTFFHRKITGRQRAGDPLEVETGSSIELSHPPGKMFVMTIDLTRLYAITEPGLYTLDVSRVDDYTKTKVRAKTLSLEIVP